MVVEYANYLAERGHNVSLWYNMINTVFTIHPLIRLTKIPLPTKVGTVIYSLVKKFHSDAIIVDIIPLAASFCIRNRARLIYFAQGYDESYHTNRIQKFLTKILYLFSLSMMKISAIAVSNQLALMLREKYNARITVIENGIDLSKFYHDPDNELLSSKKNRKSVLVLSRNDRAKGIDIAIDVINKMSADWRDKIEIWICGEELDEQILKFKARNFGWVAEDRLRCILSTADVLFYPTRHEGFGLLPLEAMACGCPVVTTDAVKYLEDQKNALVGKVGSEATLKEKLERMLADQQLTNELRNNGLITVKKYDLRHSAIKFEEAVKEIIS